MSAWARQKSAAVSLMSEGTRKVELKKREGRESGGGRRRVWHAKLFERKIQRGRDQGVMERRSRGEVLGEGLAEFKREGRRGRGHGSKGQGIGKGKGG